MPKINEQQFLELYDKNVAKIYRYIYFRVGSEEQAQDLTSEVFLKAWQYINNSTPTLSFKRGGGKLDNPRAFFYQVARNLITDFYRQKDKSPISLEEIADNSFSDRISDKTIADRIADRKDGPIEQVSLALEMEVVKKALIQLQPEYREVIIWRYLDELEIKEIAQILDKREGTVRTLLSRALAVLKEVLK
jgi:RNA polymerase sigma-70 factor (ECF subfamily)